VTTTSKRPCPACGRLAVRAGPLAPSALVLCARCLASRRACEQRPEGHEERIARYAARAARHLPLFSEDADAAIR
jgi:hypothetical protein